MVCEQVVKAVALLRAIEAGDADRALMDVSPDRFVRHDLQVGDGIPTGYSSASQ